MNKNFTRITKSFHTDAYCWRKYKWSSKPLMLYKKFQLNRSLFIINSYKHFNSDFSYNYKLSSWTHILTWPNWQIFGLRWQLLIVQYIYERKSIIALLILHLFEFSCHQSTQLPAHSTNPVLKSENSYSMMRKISEKAR